MERSFRLGIWEEGSTPRNGFIFGFAGGTCGIGLAGGGACCWIGAYRACAGGFGWAGGCATIEATGSGGGAGTGVIIVRVGWGAATGSSGSGRSAAV